MRTLYEIISDVKDGLKPDYEEIRYALLVYEFMFNMDHRVLREELMKEKETSAFIKKMRADNSFDMFKNALNKSPKDYVGVNSDPDNPEYQKFRKLGEKLSDKVIKNGSKGDQAGV